MGTQSDLSLPPIEIQSSLCNYTVAFNGLTNLAEWQPHADALIVDSFFLDRLNLPTSIPVIHVNATEDAKSLPATMDLFIALKQAGLGRGSHLLAVGGGVIQDIATFVASLYMRGISWSYAPTTFLGMADSCLGGKSSINVGEFKNLIGNFHPFHSINHKHPPTSSVHTHASQQIS
jgi:3-dehydroquinate synthase